MTRTYAIVIPARNEEAYIEKCVLSCLQQQYPPKKIEVFVVDGMSTDRTPQLVAALKERYSALHLLENRHQTTPQALNLGIRAARADIIIILGGHATLNPDYLAQCEAAFEKSPDLGCVGGVIRNVFETTEAAAIGAAMSSSFGVGDARFRTGNFEGFTDTVAFGAYKKEVFDKIGFFDEDLVRNQDDEFNFRLLKAGYRIWLSPYIKADYAVRTGFTKLRNQYYQYGFWKVYVNKKHRAITTLRQLVPAAFTAWLILSMILGIILLAGFDLLGSNLWIINILLGLIYIFSAYYFALKSAAHARTFSVMRAFFYLHFFYGLGYLEGILVFLLTGRKPADKHHQLSR
jgi:glycosyltransferase involved in cell wall biosynthesis